MRVIGIDYSLKATGMYRLDSNNQSNFLFFTQNEEQHNNYEKNSVYINSKKYEDSLDKMDAVIEVIKQVLRDEKPELVVLESRLAINHDGWESGYDIIAYFCRRYGIPVIKVAPVSVKKYASSIVGETCYKRTKEDMARYLKHETGLDYTHIADHWDDITDAYYLAAVGRDYLKYKDEFKYSVSEAGKVSIKEYPEELLEKRMEVLTSLYQKYSVIPKDKRRRKKRA